MLVSPSDTTLYAAKRESNPIPVDTNWMSMGIFQFWERCVIRRLRIINSEDFCVNENQIYPCAPPT